MRKIYKVFNAIEIVFCCFCLAGCMITLFGNAIFRQLGLPIRFANDLALAFFAYMTFIGADLAYRNNKLAHVDIVKKMFPKKVQVVQEYVILGLCLGLFILMAYLGVQLLVRSWVRPIPSLPNISYGWVIASVPLGAILMIITTIIKICENARGANSAESEE